ncbi:MAG: c-type cytochrome biogenesis protein CcmI [Labrys sp. (in: a-proteobacteria)]
MVQWIVFALLTGIAVMAVLAPLAWRRTSVTRAQSDLAVYKDQLSEIDRDRERGLIAGPEAEAARIEVARRLLDADAAAARESSSTTRNTLRTRIAAVIALIAIPAITLAVYGRYGSPALPDQPLAARLDESTLQNASIDDLIARAERHLERQPEDGEGWDVLGPAYLRQGRPADARRAFANAIRLLGSTAQREASLGESIVLSSNRIVTSEAREAFQRALKLDPAQAKARYYIGLAAEQDGNMADALAAWTSLRGEADPNGPIAQFLSREIERVGGTRPGLAGSPSPAPGPSAEDVAAAEGMSQAERGDMIKSMVERLATRLADQGGSIDEWQRLIRAYVVLGDKEKATAAAADARKALSADPASVKTIDETLKSLGLGG